MPIRTAQIEKIFNEGYGFPDLLPYIEEEEGVFILGDGSLGAIWQLKPYETEGGQEEYFLSLSSHIENILNRMPNEDLVCQVILNAKRGGQRRLKMYQEGAVAQSILDKSFLQEEGLVPKEVTLYLTLRFFPQWMRPSLWQKAGRVLGGSNLQGEPIREDLDKHRSDLMKHAQLIEGVLQAAGIVFERVLADGLTSFLYGFFNPKRSLLIDVPSLDDRKVLREQVLFNAPRAMPEGFVFDDVLMRVVSLKELPSETTPGMFSRELYQGSRFCLLDMPSDLMMVVNFSVPPVQEAVDHLQMQKGMAFMHQENWLGDKSVEALEKKKELDETLGDLFKKGEKIVQARLHWIIRHENSLRLEEDTGRLMSVLNRLNAQGIKEEMIGASLFLSCLPLNFDPYYEKFIRRAKRLRASNMADMLPLYGSLAGTKTPAQMYLNRRNEIVFFDLFDSNINPHALVIGASGAGKSFFMNDFILQNRRLDAHFFVFDKGDSYKKLSAIINGDYVSFDINHPVRMNPFAQEPTPENLSFLMSLLSQMASGGDERDRLNREEEGLLQKAVLKAYEERRTGHELTLSDVVAILNDNLFNERFGINSVMGPTLALRLTPFTDRGPYGGFFDGPNTFKPQGSFTVFELANLSAYPDLQLAVLLNLMFFVTGFVASAQMRPKRKYLIIDEAWSLLRVKNTAEFITNAFKTFRKYRCAAVAVTQELADLTRHETGLAIVANASNKVFLKQETGLIELLKDRMSLTAGTVEVLKTLETLKGRYAEGFLITDSSSGVIRLVPDPMLYWIANSESRNNQYLEQQIAACRGDVLEALKRSAEKYPKGLL